MSEEEANKPGQQVPPMATIERNTGRNSRSDDISIKLMRYTL
jgi:hypothetical protein